VSGVRRKKSSSSNSDEEDANSSDDIGNRFLRSAQKMSNESLHEGSSNGAISAPSEDLYELNIEAMVVDIGDQLVPVVGPEYDEKNPTRNKMKMEDFLNKFWCINSPDLYLHQWQFPLAKREVSPVARDLLLYD
jgi:hypothetical protein